MDCFESNESQGVRLIFLFFSLLVLCDVNPQSSYHFALKSYVILFIDLVSYCQERPRRVH